MIPDHRQSAGCSNFRVSHGYELRTVALHRTGCFHRQRRRRRILECGADGMTGAGTSLPVMQMEILVRHDPSTTAMTPGSADGPARAQVAASASANASVLVTVAAKASAPVPKSASTKVRSAAYLQKQASTARPQYCHSMLPREMLMYTNRGPASS
jgi:hypothetical protein